MDGNAQSSDGTGAKPPFCASHRVAAALFGLLLAGCSASGGGSPGGGAVVSGTPSPYAGTWIQSPSDGPAGQEFVISSAGAVDATLIAPADQNPPVGFTGNATGTISDTGAMVVSTQVGTMVMDAEGTLAINSAGHLVGTLTEFEAPYCAPGTACSDIVVDLGAVSIDMTRSGT